MSLTSADRKPLTARQRDVLQHAALGLSNKRIGEELGIAEQTVKNHLAKAMRNLEIHDRTHAVVVAIGEGWIGLPVGGSDGSPVHVVPDDVAGER